MVCLHCNLSLSRAEVGIIGEPPIPIRVTVWTAKIKYVNLGLLIWLFYFDLVDSLLQFIERNSDHSVSKRMLLII